MCLPRYVRPDIMKSFWGLRLSVSMRIEDQFFWYLSLFNSFLKAKASRWNTTVRMICRTFYNSLTVYPFIYDNLQPPWTNCGTLFCQKDTFHPLAWFLLKANFLRDCRKRPSPMPSPSLQSIFSLVSEQPSSWSTLINQARKLFSPPTPLSSTP